MEETALFSKLGHFRTQKRGEEDVSTGTASVPAAQAPIVAGAQLVAPAGKRLARRGGAEVAPASASEGGVKFMSTSQREVLLARLKVARATAGDVEGKADDQPPQKIVGTYYTADDTTNAAGDGAGRRKLQTCADGSGVTVTSSEFPLLEGCLAEFEDDRFLNGRPSSCQTRGSSLPAQLTPPARR